jgi:hypothetical protein
VAKVRTTSVRKKKSTKVVKARHAGGAAYPLSALVHTSQNATSTGSITQIVSTSAAPTASHAARKRECGWMTRRPCSAVSTFRWSDSSLAPKSFSIVSSAMCTGCVSRGVAECRLPCSREPAAFIASSIAWPACAIRSSTLSPRARPRREKVAVRPRHGGGPPSAVVAARARPPSIVELRHCMLPRSVRRATMLVERHGGAAAGIAPDVSARARIGARRGADEEPRSCAAKLLSWASV